MDVVQAVSVGVSVALLLLVVGMVRRRKLAPDYGLVWIGASLVLLVLSVRRGLLDTLARLLQVYYPPSVLLLGLVLVSFASSLAFSIALSRHRAEIDRLAEEVALLREALRDPARPRATREPERLPEPILAPQERGPVRPRT